MVLELAGKPDTQYRQRLCTDFLGQKEVFIESEASRLIIIRIETMGKCVVPAVFIDRTVFNGAYCVFPLIAGGKVCTLDDAAAGETEHSGL